MVKVQGTRQSKPKKRNALHVLAASVVLVALGVGIERSLHSSLFYLKSVVVEPITEGYPVTEAQVLQMAKVNLGKTPLVDLDLEPIELKLMKNPWVKGVVIGKQFPNKLSLKIIERTPIALMMSPRGKAIYLESDGSVFEDQTIIYSKELPILHGFKMQDDESMQQVRKLLFEWFEEKNFPGVKVSSLSYDERLGLRAVVAYPLKNGQFMRPVIEMGMNAEDALANSQVSFRRVLEYLAARSLTASKIWLGDGKKVVVKMARGS